MRLLGGSNTAYKRALCTPAFCTAICCWSSITVVITASSQENYVQQSCRDRPPLCLHHLLALSTIIFAVSTLRRVRLHRSHCGLSMHCLAGNYRTHCCKSLRFLKATVPFVSQQLVTMLHSLLKGLPSFE